MPTVAMITTKAGLRALKALYRMDRNNVYFNPRDVPFSLNLITPPYDGLYWRLEPDRVAGITHGTLKAYEPYAPDGNVVNDGATLAPDWPRGVMQGVTLHDPGYLESDAIARAWQDEPYEPGGDYGRDWIARLTAGGSATWTMADVRQLMDAIMGDTMRRSRARRIVYRGFYSVVRLAGGIFRGKVGKLPLSLAALLWLSGCSGCMSPPRIIDFPEGPPEPVREMRDDARNH